MTRCNEQNGNINLYHSAARGRQRGAVIVLVALVSRPGAATNHCAAAAAAVPRVMEILGIYINRTHFSVPVTVSNAHRLVGPSDETGKGKRESGEGTG